MAELAHQNGHVGCHRPLGVRRMVARRGWLGGRAVPPQVRTDDAEARVHELRCYAMPGGPRAGVPVEKQHGRGIAAEADVELRVADVDICDGEPREHDYDFSSGKSASL